MPTVSVIIPTYNRALKLKEAIQSVLDQTYTDYEVIVVDDGSVDNTREVVNELKQRSDKLVYIYQENRGRSAARNYGISLAKGDYIAFLDSDDRFLPEKLSVQVKALENNGDFGMAYSPLIFMGENGEVLGSSSKARTRLSGWIYPELLFFKGTIIITSGVMVRASVLSEIGGFDEEMHICEDLDLWRSIARRYKVLQIEQPLSIYAYRLNDQPDVLENVKARSFYYQKAIAEDPALEKSIQSKLFLEMYSQYGAVALFERNIP
jgi:glycosyltransferase involved in cell wall biosynthesis